MTQPLSGKWLYYGTEVTSGSGRLTFTIPPDKALAIGIYPVRMVVRWGVASVSPPALLVELHLLPWQQSQC